MNFILSNGDTSQQKDEMYPTKHTHEMHPDALNKTRSVSVYFDECIWGFTFFDKDNKLLWEHGWTGQCWMRNETFQLAED